MKSKYTKVLKAGFGQRVHYLLALTGLSRSAFCTKYNLYYSTVTDWTKEISIISPGHMNKLLKALEKERILCSSHWLLTGENDPPQRYEGAEFPFKAQLISRKIPLADQGIKNSGLQAEIQLLWSNTQADVHKFEIFFVGDRGMEPYYTSHDLVGCYFAFTKELESLYGQVCVIEAEPGQFTVRKFLPEETYFLGVPTNKDIPTQTIHTLKRAGLIHWYRRIMFDKG